ncbi:DUF4258 domain-containing protein [Muriicola sp. Z0-33]|uniref:DUF4258 domain-containing protein n=1 Tax=Muriicola sp. Z0-33 TaxID=2816957 RepID=UPI0022386D5D|nr:DUF4258 domain-containing protein [Muriicola sp. Z0-33]MCW5516696.1 DUF4258 domain-containing protein [Muriicola sp. Z0-33]
MPFLKRLGFYLVGLSIGLVFLAFFFKKKSEETGTSFCYFPNCRVLKDIRSKPISFSDQAATEIEAKGLDSTDIAYFLSDGNIDFKNSDTSSKPCKTYIIKAKFNGNTGVMKIANCEQKTEVQEFKIE